MNNSTTLVISPDRRMQILNLFEKQIWKSYGKMYWILFHVTKKKLPHSKQILPHRRAPSMLYETRCPHWIRPCRRNNIKRIAFLFSASIFQKERTIRRSGAPSSVSYYHSL